MDRELVLIAAVVLLSAVALFMCWLHAFGRWRQIRRAEALAAGQSVDILIDEQEGAAAAARKGLDRAALEALPTFVYSSSDLDSQSRSTGLADVEQAKRSSGSRLISTECPVCLSEFQEAERGRLLPNCGHRFHVECIDTWLLANGTCPVCRASCAADVAVHSVGAVGVQYPTNVLFWGSNVSVLAVTVSSAGAVPVHITAVQAPHPQGSVQDSLSSSSTDQPASSSSGSISRLNSLRRLLSRERIHTAPQLYSKV